MDIKTFPKISFCVNCYASSSTRMKDKCLELGKKAGWTLEQAQQFATQFNDNCSTRLQMLTFVKQISK